MYTGECAMRDIPQWILKTLKDDKLLCRKCEDSMNAKNIRACGIRRSYKNAKKEVLFLEIWCLTCEELAIYEIEDMSLIEFSFEIIEEMERQSEDEHMDAEIDKHMSKKDDFLFSDTEERPPRLKKENLPNKKKKRSKITQKEIKDVVTFLNNSGKTRYHDEFLIELGMSPDEIDSYKLKRKNDK
tara:strand:+ start:27195 stop:27749 length:555 start_codon:yes stop_codon:yes gene_type:complete